MNAQTTTSTELNDGLQELFGAAPTPLRRVSTWGFEYTAWTSLSRYPPPKPNCLSLLIITAS